MRCILTKNLSGWEVMEIFAGGTGKSDKLFMLLAAAVDETLTDTNVPESVRHQALQMALVFMCGINQLSPGAYFLRRDLFPSLVSFMKTPETERYAFEAILLLAILANFHKSDAAKLNPYLQRIKNADDELLMHKICWAANFALNTAVKAYQEIHNDEPESFTSTLSSFLTSMRPDRALASTPVDPPRELFKNQPIEACVVLLPLYEFVYANTKFVDVMLETLSDDKNSRVPPIPFTILTLSSYLLSHATSTSSARSLAYANLSLHCLLAFSESDTMMEALCQPSNHVIRLCRQRLPHRPVPKPGRAPVCALLDCCILWLRHNLHKRLEVHGYINCIWVCYRVVWYLSRMRTKLEYEWKELWTSILGLLNFLTAKSDSLFTTGGVESLIRETTEFLELCLAESSSFLQKPQYLHELIYEVVRNLEVFEKQLSLLKSLSTPASFGRKRSSSISEDPDVLMDNLLETAKYYQGKITLAGATSANQGLWIVGREIDRDGLSGFKNKREFKSPRVTRIDEVVGFSRFACADGLGLMP
ncbi:hypothetical protein L218DRAFT_914759 [Marasmius fiardii PR-910]|nr:hypothetical protein L218DRAFT_914759 [Marasmius fiardii PR-910]